MDSQHHSTPIILDIPIPDKQPENKVVDESQLCPVDRQTTITQSPNSTPVINKVTSELGFAVLKHNALTVHLQDDAMIGFDINEVEEEENNSHLDVKGHYAGLHAMPSASRQQ
ncbi:hypothetical protein ACH5RR_039118 [Cinchona calisaya]|uniref:Uncharacterized protein n=1 Tax=Cinchona calisaya TaxID=153742 RepID=A0ABD2Y1F9_9GENT